MRFFHNCGFLFQFNNACLPNKNTSTAPSPIERVYCIVMIFTELENMTKADFTTELWEQEIYFSGTIAC